MGHGQDDAARGAVPAAGWAARHPDGAADPTADAGERPRRVARIASAARGDEVDVAGHPDPDVEWSREQMKKRLAPLGDAKYEFVICVAETGEMIGTGGCHMVVGELGWPVIGYMLRKEFWGRGYATELVNGFLKAWWALPRAEVELKVEKSSVSAEGWPTGASQNVLRKCKLDLVKVWEEDDLRDPTQRAVLYAFVGRKPAAS
ncbi:hypothetical protein ACCO45_007151 [Purpureocillium lilacinum]|uniref:Uncharacterized protein n=1 Tax=Purpureocillium lilacinum TaxID=33203 RepID=A0ACC4DSY0_PURLI